MPHQPRLGAAVSGAVLDTTGVGGGVTGTGVDGALAPIGAGSRIVERRRGASCGAGSADANAGAGFGSGAAT